MESALFITIGKHDGLILHYRMIQEIGCFLTLMRIEHRVIVPGLATA